MTTTINTAAAPARAARGFTVTGQLRKLAVGSTSRTARGFTVTTVLLTRKPAVAATSRSARGFAITAVQLRKLAVATTARTARGFSGTVTVYPRVVRSPVASTSRGRGFAVASSWRNLALASLTRPRGLAATPNTFTSISVTVALPTFSTSRSLTTTPPVLLSGRGQIVRWIFEDPLNANEVWTVPMNPNKMTSPYRGHSTTTTATSPITGQASGIRTPDVAVEWQFSGDLKSEAHFNQLLYWAGKPNRIYVTDHLGRKWLCFLTKFDPVPKGTSPTNQWRYTYTVSALVYGRAGEPLV